MKNSPASRYAVLSAACLLSLQFSVIAQETPYIYGIFDHDPAPTDYLNRIKTGTGGGGGWVTATVAVGANTNDTSGVDFTFLSSQGHTVICRLNHGYFPNGTIPLPAKYDDFAKRCANFVSNSPGCSIWTIGNELNIAGEWPVNFTNNHSAYVTPSNYAACFRKVYDAIKAVQPQARVLPQAPAAFSGPFAANSQNLMWLGTNYTHDANPLNWVTHLRSMLTNIANTGPLDGIALHVSSRGYSCADIHSTEKRTAGGQSIYWSFYIYKDWVDLGIPSSLYHLPLYATECNGYYYWKGGHPENIFATYQAGWMQEVYAEINRYNQNAIATGKPVYRCFNMYRWGSDAYDEWSINRSDNPYKFQILADLDEAITNRYTWPTTFQSLVPVGLNFYDPGDLEDSVPVCDFAGVVPQRVWFNLTAGGNGTLSLGGGMSVTWATPGGGTHRLPIGVTPGDFALMQGYLDTGDTTTNTITVSGLKFALYDVIVYVAGNNAGSPGEYRVARYTLTTSKGSLTKYIMDDPNLPAFDGSYTEVDSLTGGSSTPAGNYIRFRNVTGSSFTLRGSGEYASGTPPHPRAPLNALQIIPINAAPVLRDPQYSGGQFSCVVEGVSNVNYIVQASTNLVNWTSVRTNPAPFLFTDSLAPSLPRRFYRGLFLP